MLERFLNERHFTLKLLSVSFFLNGLMAFSRGASYWFDTVIYFEIARVITNPAAFHQLDQSNFGLVFQHVVPGLPLLILFFEKIFGSMLWPAFAALQYSLSAVACVYFARGFDGQISRISQLILVVLIETFAYYSGFHSAILTESLSASITLLIIGVTVRCLDGHYPFYRALIALLILTIIGCQFRSYLVVIGAGCATLVVFDRRRWSQFWLYGVVAVVAVGSILAYPAYRAAAGSDFKLLNVNALMLMHASYVAWDLDERSQRALDGVVFDPVIRDKIVLQGDALNMNDVVKLVSDLEARGIGRDHAGELINAASKTVRTQSAEIMLRQIQLSLSSLGFQYLATCCDPSRGLMRGFDGKAMLDHFKRYYRWNAGLAKNYQRTFKRYNDVYLQPPYLYSQAAIDWYTSRVGPYIFDNASMFRPALGITRLIPLDLIVVLGLTGFALKARRNWQMILIVGLCMAPIYAATLMASVVGDTRYSHPLWPLYFLGIVIAGEVAAHKFRPPPQTTS